MNELISVIVPVYNVEKYLKKSLDSISNQTYENIEIIVIDDGSTDNGYIIYNQCKLLDNRIKIIFQNNGGLSAARNTGILNATGELLMFLDSDDYIENTMIEILYEKMLKDKSDLAVCNFNIVQEDKKVEIIKNSCLFAEEEKRMDNKQYFNTLILNQNPVLVVSWGKLYKKKIFNEISFTVNKIHEDEFVIHKIIDLCTRISYIEKPLYYYLQRADSITGKKYSIKNLDSVEALLIRARYFIEKKDNYFAERTCEKAMAIYLQGYKQLNMEDKIVLKRMKELKRMYNEQFYQFLRITTNMRSRCICILFRINPYLLFCFRNKKSVK